MIKTKNKNISEMLGAIEKRATGDNVGLALAFEAKKFRSKKRARSALQFGLFGGMAAILFAAIFVVANWQSVYTRFAYYLGFSEQPKNTVAEAIVQDIKDSQKLKELSRPSVVQSIDEVDTGGAIQAVDFGPDNMLYIPKIGVTAPIIFPTTTNEWELLQILKSGVIHYPQTVEFDEVGNVAITGHSSNYWWIQSDYNAIFSLLPELRPGDEAMVVYKGRKYTYRVTDSFVVNPWEAAPYIAPTQKPILTLITCVPVGTNWQRLVVRLDLASAQDKNQLVPQIVYSEPEWKTFLEKQIENLFK